MGELAAILRQTHHRPWPLPSKRWVTTQTWHDLLFAHWTVDTAAMRALVPQPFELDLFNDQTWLGIVPFRMSHVRPRAVPPAPWLSAFPELNVRTYVRVDGKPGIYFFSLDAARLAAVGAARMMGLPYYWASMTCTRRGSTIAYASQRMGTRAAAQLIANYTPLGPTLVPLPGTLDHFLTERYCLYAHDPLGRPYRLEIHHPPWDLQPAIAELERNTMTAPLGIRLDGDPLLHFSRRQRMVAWLPEYL